MINLKMLGLQKYFLETLFQLKRIILKRKKLPN